MVSEVNILLNCTQFIQNINRNRHRLVSIRILCNIYKQQRCQNENQEGFNVITIDVENEVTFLFKFFIKFLQKFSLSKKFCKNVIFSIKE